MAGEHARGAWNELKGDLKAEFGRLTDDDFMVAEGDFESMWGRIQQRYGDVKDNLREKYDNLIGKRYPDRQKRVA